MDRDRRDPGSVPPRRISAICSDGPFTVIEAEPECSILQSYTAGARDADGTSYSGEVTVCTVMRELATIRLGEVSDPSTHIDREYGVVADSTGVVMGSTSSWTYPTPPATRADLLMRLSTLSAWPNLEDQPVQPMVFYPHHGGRTLTITRYGNGYYSMVAPVRPSQNRRPYHRSDQYSGAWTTSPTSAHPIPRSQPTQPSVPIIDR